MARLDRCLLIPGFERFDSGYMAYLGMVEVDVYHNHPIVRGFVHILKEKADERRRAAAGGGKVNLAYSDLVVQDRKGEIDGLHVANGGVQGSFTSINTARREKDVEANSVPKEKPKGLASAQRNKWWKVITLYNNPSLVLDRLQEAVEKTKKGESTLKDDAVDAMVGAGSVLLASAAGAPILSSFS